MIEVINPAVLGMAGMGSGGDDENREIWEHAGFPQKEVMGPALARSLYSTDHSHSSHPQEKLRINPRSKGSNIQLREAGKIQVVVGSPSHASLNHAPLVETRYMDQQEGNVINHATMSHDDSLTANDGGDGLDSKWIHRDKLAGLERQEIRQGLRLDTQQAFVGDKLGVSPTTGGAQDLSPATTPLEGSGVRKVSKPAVSRIPVATSSPLAPASSPERVSPMHGRNGPIRLVPNPNGTIQYAKPRDRKTSEASITSRNAAGRPASGLFAYSSGSDTAYLTPPIRYRETSSAARNLTPTKNVNQTSRPQTPVSRTASTASKKKRLSSGPVEIKPRRPIPYAGPRAAVARPEGEAPWLADMYAPDPMLPQDEQIVPWHAKRLGLPKPTTRRDFTPEQFSSTVEANDVAATTSTTTHEDNSAEEREDDSDDYEDEYDLIRQREKSPSFLTLKKAKGRNASAQPDRLETMPENAVSKDKNGGVYTPRAEEVSSMNEPPTPLHHSEFPSNVDDSSTAVDASERSSPKLAPALKPQHRQSSTQLHGGYKTVPTLQTPEHTEEKMMIHPALRRPSPPRAPSQMSFKSRYPEIPRPTPRTGSSRSRAVTTAPMQAMAPLPVRALNMEEPPQPEKEKKGCVGCCTVM